jgi:hypothetical protein
MGKGVSFVGGKFISKLLQNKFISITPVFGRENQRVSQMNERLVHDRDWKD